MSVIVPTQSFKESEYSLSDDVKSCFPFELDDFQKYAIHAIRRNEHVLITAHTGSGKSVPAEYAIQYYHSLSNVKSTEPSTHPRNIVIYTSPIKSLTNQKFYDFQKKFPECSFGLLTGDIKFNTDAQCLLMTTEILRNALMRQEQSNSRLVGFDQFHLDIDRVACVIFDEIHYINDIDRGSVWEESILWLPRRIPMILLSATIDRAQSFAEWVATQKERTTWYLSNDKRVVPLEHHLMISLPKFAFKKQENPRDNKFVNTMSRWMMNAQVNLGSRTKSLRVSTFPLKLPQQQEPQQQEPLYRPSSGLTNQPQIHRGHLYKLAQIKEYLDRKRIRLSPDYMMNSMADTLKAMDRLPAIVFMFSRRQCETMAFKIRNSMFPTEEGEYESTQSTDYQTTTMATDVLYRMKSILKKLPNWEEYIHTFEYERFSKLLSKGVAYHHSGVHPIFREMIELLFQEGYVKLLFSTETLAVGVNMPARTVVMSSVQKWDGTKHRALHPYEYTQMAGRAGRRGMDKRGYVYHLLWRDIPSSGTYEYMLSGKPQSLLSKFRLSPLTVLRIIRSLSLLSSDETETRHVSKTVLIQEIQGTMIQQEIQNQTNQTKRDYNDIVKRHQQLVQDVYSFNTPIDTIKEFIQLDKKDKKRLDYSMKYDSILKEKDIYMEWEKVSAELDTVKESLLQIQSYIPTVVSIILTHLMERSLVKILYEESNSIELTSYGNLMAQFHENPTNLACMIESIEECCRGRETMIELLAGFASGIVNCEGNDCLDGNVNDDRVKDIFQSLETIERNEENWVLKQSEQIDMDEIVKVGYTLIPFIKRWCDAEDEITCKQILKELNELQIYTGDFQKALLKMNNCAQELCSLFERQGKVGCVANLSKIPEYTLKHIITNQSLYL